MYNPIKEVEPFMKIKLLLDAACVTGVMLATATTVPGQYGQPFVACSADGNRIVAVFFAGGISNSINAGRTWRSNNVPYTNWFAVASSADGSMLAASIYDGGIYTSTNYGTTWAASSAPVDHWLALACSQDGTTLVAAPDSFGPVYTSTNAGSTWRSNSLPRLWWKSVASSADGLKLAVTAEIVDVEGSIGGIYTSVDAGGTWISNSVANTNWQAIASSADGTRLVAAVIGGGIYVSTDWGTNWDQTSAPVAQWEWVTSSADGTILAATSVNGVRISTNSGSTWTLGYYNGGDLFPMAASADGSTMVVGDWFRNYIWIIHFTPTPFLSVGTSNNNVVLSWIVPSIKFVLQQNTDLGTPNWTDVGTALTLTNLRYQTIVAPATNKMFFRLAPW